MIIKKGVVNSIRISPNSLIMKNLITLIFLLIIVACNQANKKQSQPITNELPNYKLELLWETDTTLRTPESVLHDRKRSLLYVSCVNENPWEKDGNGYISKIDKSGNVINLKWITGLNGPKGMGFPL